MLSQQNHAAGGANGSIMVGMFVCLCLASKKPSEQEFFAPARTDLGVKLFSGQNLNGRDNKHVSILVTPVFGHKKEFLFLNFLKGFQ
jgi:hypothetical protein